MLVLSKNYSMFLLISKYFSSFMLKPTGVMQFSDFQHFFPPFPCFCLKDFLMFTNICGFLLNRLNHIYFAILIKP